jgi:hypothetical protein
MNNAVSLGIRLTVILILSLLSGFISLAYESRIIIHVIKKGIKIDLI